MASFRVKYFHSWRFLQRLVEWLQFLMMETWWVSKICLALLSQDLGACCCCSANSSSSVPNLTRAGWTRKLVWQCRYCKNLRVSLSLEMRVCARYKAVWWGRGNPVLQWREVFCTSSFGSGCVFGTAQSQILGQFRFLSCFKSSLWELSLQPWGSQLRFDWENDCSFFLPVTCATCKHWQPPELTGCLQGYVSPAMALWKHSEPLFDHLVPQTTLLPLQEELSCFPSVVFGSSHRKAIQAVKSFLIHYCGVLNKLTHGVGAAAERAVQKKERLSFSWGWCTASVLLLNSHVSLLCAPAPEAEEAAPLGSALCNPLGHWCVGSGGRAARSDVGSSNLKSSFPACQQESLNHLLLQAVANCKHPWKGRIHSPSASAATRGQVLAWCQWLNTNDIHSFQN